MKKQAFSAFDAADYLKSQDDIAAYLAAASEDEDPRVLVVAMGDVIRARNVSKIARDAGLTRERACTRPFQLMAIRASQR